MLKYDCVGSHKNPRQMDQLLRLLQNINFWTALGAIGAVVAAIVPLWIHFRTQNNPSIPDKVKPDTTVAILQSAYNELLGLEPFDAAEFTRKFSDPDHIDEALWRNQIVELFEKFANERNVFAKIRPFLDEDLKGEILTDLSKFDCADQQLDNAQAIFLAKSGVAFEFRPKALEVIRQQIGRLI